MFPTKDLLWLKVSSVENKVFKSYKEYFVIGKSNFYEMKRITFVFKFTSKKEILIQAKEKLD